GPPAHEVVWSPHKPPKRDGSSLRDALHQLLEGGEAVPGDKAVDVWERGDHAAGDRLISELALMRVHPDHRVREPGETRYLRAEQCRVAALPAVRAEHDDRATCDTALPPLVQERLERVAEPGAAAPVGYGRGGAPQSDVRVASTQSPGYWVEPGAQRAYLGVQRRHAHRSVREPQHRIRIRLHRATHVGEHDQPPRLAPPGPVREAGRFAALAQHAAHRPLQVDPAVPRPAIPPGTAAAPARRPHGARPARPRPPRRRGRGGAAGAAPPPPARPPRARR